MNKRVFSLPINPKLSEDFVVNTFLPFLKEYKEYILDLYFTCRIPPFTQDAMGDTFVEDNALIESACYISNQSDIPLSATFNNIWVRPDQKNLDLWIKEFAPVYNSGVRVVTLPHTSWVSCGQIQSAFPELFIKNTILREVTKPSEIVSLAEAGFHYINLDRDLMRDREQLLRIQKAKDYCAYLGKPVMLSMLVNETCWGGCPIMPEHYQYNATRTENDPIFFASPISRVSCSTWDVEHPESDLKAANLPPWRDDWIEMQELGIDTFKLHGRESMMRLQESMDLIRRWADKEEYMFPEYKKYEKQLKMKESPLKKWREKIKTCKFDCWDCNYCEAVVEAHMKKSDLIMHPQGYGLKLLNDNNNMKEFILAPLREYKNKFKKGDIIIFSARIEKYKNENNWIKLYETFIQQTQKIGMKFTLISPTPIFPNLKENQELGYLCQEEWYRPAWKISPLCFDELKKSEWFATNSMSIAKIKQ